MISRILLLISLSLAIGTAWSSQVIILDTQSINPRYFDVLPDALTLHTCRVTGDCSIDQQEIVAITGFTDAACLTKAQLLTACTHLQLKNKFEKITLTFEKRDDATYDLAVELKSCWTFKGARIKGLFANNDFYQQYYSINPGDIFDINKHQNSIAAIKESLMNQGYCNVQVLDQLEYCNATKSIIAHIYINPEQRFVIESIQVVLNNTFAQADQLERKIQKFFNVLKGYYYTAELLSKHIIDLKRSLAAQGILHALISVKEEYTYQKGTIALTIQINLKHHKPFLFFGNHFFSQQVIIQDILSFARKLDFLPSSVVKQELLTAYKKQGYIHTTIDVYEDETYHYIVIQEGKRIRINNIILAEAPHAPLDYSQQFFAASIAHSWYDEHLLAQGAARCGAWYHQQGFWDFKFVDDVLQNNADGTYDVVFSASEGTQRFLGHVTVYCGHDKITVELPSYRPGAPFDTALLTVHRKAIQDYCARSGYSNPSIHYELIPVDNRINVEWYITGNIKKRYFGPLVLNGITNMPYHIIERELCFKPGDIWDNRALEQTLVKLRNLNIFEAVHIYPYEFEQEYSPVILSLVEDDPFELRVRAGFQQVSKNLAFRSGSTYKVGCSLLYKNPFYAADFFGLEFDITKFYRNFNVSYLRPWIFNYPITMILKGYSNKYTQPVFIGSKRPLYQAVQEGFLASFNRRWLNAGAGFNIGLELMETTDLSYAIAQAINFSAALINKKIPYFFAEPSVLLDFLDDPLNPTTGTYTVFSCKTMIPFKQPAVNFFKIMFEQSGFYTVQSVTIGGHIRFGHIFNQDFKDIMPPERFYLGGENSIRSYQRDFAPPLGVFIDEQGEAQKVPQGGKTMVHGTLELRFPLYGKLSGAVFQDLGTLIERSLTEIVPSRFLTATGFGLRYQTPIGPFRFDIGWKWFKSEPCESRFAAFFTLGQAF